MSINPIHSDPYSAFDREYFSELIEREIFGALLGSVHFRQIVSNMTKSELARRSGKDKTAISHLLKGPTNLSIRTIAELANALDMDFKFAFVDRINPTQIFTSVGMRILDQRFNHQALSTQQPTISQWGSTNKALQSGGGHNKLEAFYSSTPVEGQGNNIVVGSVSKNSAVSAQLTTSTAMGVE
jgi:transcriptional regulator with XRE-family HTH domain